MSTALIRRDDARLTISFTEAALEMKANALAIAGMIGGVTTPEENAAAVQAQVELKAVESQFEKARVEATKPFLDAQREIKAKVDGLRKDLLDELTAFRGHRKAGCR